MQVLQEASKDGMAFLAWNPFMTCMALPSAQLDLEKRDLLPHSSGANTDKGAGAEIINFTSNPEQLGSLVAAYPALVLSFGILLTHPTPPSQCCLDSHPIADTGTTMSVLLATWHAALLLGLGSLAAAHCLMPDTLQCLL